MAGCRKVQVVLLDDRRLTFNVLVSFISYSKQFWWKNENCAKVISLLFLLCICFLFNGPQ